MGNTCSGAVEMDRVERVGLEIGLEHCDRDRRLRWRPPRRPPRRAARAVSRAAGPLERETPERQNGGARVSAHVTLRVVDHFSSHE